MRDIVELHGVFFVKLGSPARRFILFITHAQQWLLCRQIKTLMFPFKIHKSSHLQSKLIVFPMKMAYIIVIFQSIKS